MHAITLATNLLEGNECNGTFDVVSGVSEEHPLTLFACARDHCNYLFDRECITAACVLFINCLSMLGAGFSGIEIEIQTTQRNCNVTLSLFSGSRRSTRSS